MKRKPMTGKWEAKKTPGIWANCWYVIERGKGDEYPGGYRKIADWLTEPEARAIAGCRETRAERDSAVALLLDLDARAHIVPAEFDRRLDDFRASLEKENG